MPIAGLPQSFFSENGSFLDSLLDFLNLFEPDVEDLLNVVVVVLKEGLLIDEVNDLKLAFIGNEDSVVLVGSVLADNLAFDSVHFLEHGQDFVLELNAKLVVIEEPQELIHDELGLRPRFGVNCAEMLLQLDQVDQNHHGVLQGLDVARRSKSLGDLLSLFRNNIIVKNSTLR